MNGKNLKRKLIQENERKTKISYDKKVIKFKENQGITLLALVITIIVLLILAGISLNSTFGEKGIITRTSKAKEQHEIADYKDKIEISRGSTAIDGLGKVDLDKFIDQIYKDKIVPQGNITKIDNEKAKVVTEEGYEFIITANKIEYTGKGQGGNIGDGNQTGGNQTGGNETSGNQTGGDEQDEPKPPQSLQQNDIVITINPTIWTNKNVTVTIKNNIPGNFTLQYSYDRTTWSNYTGPIEVSENKEIYASVKNKKDERSGIAHESITKIDKKKPQITSAEATTNSVEIKATDDASGIVGYALTTSNTEPQDYTTCENTKNITIRINDLEQNITYYAWVKDEAGNVSTAVRVATKQVVESEGNITFTYNPTGWTNDSITITGTSNVEGYIVQLSKDGTFPSTATEVKSITVTENQTIYGRLVDSKNQANGQARREITKIDKEKPQITSAEATTNSVEIKATDDASGIVGYAITTTNTAPTSYTTCANSTNVTIPINDLAQNITYYTWVKDEAGNVSDSMQVATKQVVESEGNITFTYNPTGWTNDRITITGTSNVEGYIVQLSKDGTFPSTATEVKSITVTENQTIYGRLVDSKNQANGQARREITKIDKEKPQIISAEATTNSVEIKATDNASGIVGYAITTTNTAPTSYTTCANSTNVTIPINDLTQNVTYYTWVKDEAGNVSDSMQVATKQVVASEGNITFTYNPTGWTNDRITITGTSNVEGYIVQLSKDGTFPSTATEVRNITVTENQTIYGRLVDNKNQANGQASRGITKIDKEKPVITETIPEMNSIQIKATDTKSGIVGYKVTTTNTKPSTFETCTNTKALDITVNGLSQGTTYYVWTKDEAGNVSEGTEVTTKKPVELKDLTVGEYISYDTGNTEIGDEGIVLCRVLWPVGSDYGFQIVTDLGYIKQTISGRYGIRAAPTSLNNTAMQYMNSSFSLDARCAGTYPYNDGLTFTEKTNYSFNSTWNLPNISSHLNVDMAQAGSELNYFPTGDGELCWLCDFHLSYSSTNSCYASVACSQSLRNSLLWEGFKYLKTSRPPDTNKTETRGVRGILLMKESVRINSGNGTKENPYRLSI